MKQNKANGAFRINTIALLRRGEGGPHSCVRRSFPTLAAHSNHLGKVFKTNSKKFKYNVNTIKYTLLKGPAWWIFTKNISGTSEILFTFSPGQYPGLPAPSSTRETAILISDITENSLGNFQHHRCLGPTVGLRRWVALRPADHAKGQVFGCAVRTGNDSLA